MQLSFKTAAIYLLAAVFFQLVCPKSVISTNPTNDFNLWFENKTLRINYFLAGNNTSQSLFIDDFIEEPYWSGPHNHLIDKMGLGTHKVEVTDKTTGLLIFSQGFCTLFQEWQTVNEAKIINRAFEQVSRIPYPKKDITLTFFSRNKSGLFDTLSQLDIDPNSNFITRRDIIANNVKKILYNGTPNNKLDIAFIAEGYTSEQMEKFSNDVKRFTDFLFTQQPFDSLKNDINIWAIESISESEGPSNPGLNFWNNTATESSFYTFGIERYLTTSRYKKTMDIAAITPANIVYILVNSAEYGGGGIYNHYNITTADHALSEIVFIHELGHGLAGLADEYYSSDVAYQEYYPLHIEPWEPNITTLVNFENKWKDLVLPNTPIPTPTTEDFETTIGVFEGGGYASKGIYRPYLDCRMKSNTAVGFCPVCQSAIKRIVQSYTDKPIQ